MKSRWAVYHLELLFPTTDEGEAEANRFEEMFAEFGPGKRCVLSSYIVTKGLWRGHYEDEGEE